MGVERRDCIAYAVADKLDDFRMSIDPDDLYGDAVVCKIEISVRRNGAMSVAGAINDKEWALSMLQAAMDSVRSYHDRQRIENGGLIIPPHAAPERPS